MCIPFPIDLCKIFLSVDLEVSSLCDTFVFLLLIIRCSINLTQMRPRIFIRDLETKVHDRADPRTADTHPVSRPEWRSNLRTVLSLLDEHDERHRPPIQGIDIRPLATPACRGCRASLTESETGSDIQQGCRFWLLSADVTDPPPSPRDTNLSMYPHEGARRSSLPICRLHCNISSILYIYIK